MTEWQKPRAPAVAGIFYPAEPAELRRTVASLLADAEDDDVEIGGEEGGAIKAILAPHAGYAYCGPVAAAAYKFVRQLRGKIDRVVIIGPAHYGEFDGIAVPSASYFETPLCSIPVDSDAIEVLVRLPHVVVNDDAHASEHSIEVQLPFIIMTLGIVPIVPLVVGGASDSEVAGVLQSMWDENTLVVVTSELSRYRDDATARQQDALTAKYIRLLEIDRIGKKEACGHRVIRGLLREVRRRSLRVTELALGNSGENGGDLNSVIGYGAFAITG